MNSKDENETSRLKRIRWWFWLLLIAPAAFSIAATMLSDVLVSGEEQLGLMVSLNLLGALPLNGICSACCAVHLSRVRTGETRLAWLVLGTLGFFALNVALAFAGCAAGGAVLDTVTR
jgi:hypothetical protein